MKMPPPGCRHVYQRKPNRKPGSGLSIQPVYFLNPHTCHFFCLTSLPKFRNTKLIFFLHSSYTKISLCSLSNTNMYFLPFYHPYAKLAGTCLAPVWHRKKFRPLHTLASAAHSARYGSSVWFRSTCRKVFKVCYFYSSYCYLTLVSFFSSRLSLVQFAQSLTYSL